MCGVSERCSCRERGKSWRMGNGRVSGIDWSSVRTPALSDYASN